MAATTLSVGDLAIIGVSTEDTIPGGATANDSISFILLKPIGSGTTIFFTDRDWNGTSFAGAGGYEGTFTYTAAADLAAGTVVTISQPDLTGAGMALSSGGETIYAYQGAINAPTKFLHAVDIADGNPGFDGTELVGAGLANGFSAVAITVDNAEFGARTNNIQTGDLFSQINNNSDWVQNDNSPQDGTATGTPAFTAPDAQIWVAASGAGEAIVTINLDATYSSGTLGYQIVRTFQNDANLFHPSDITLDTVRGKFFFIDSDISGGHNRIVQGSISQLLNNPGAPITFTVLYSDTGTTSASSMRTLSVDTANGIIYFDHGTTFNKIVYDTAGQTATVLADLTTDFGANNFHHPGGDRLCHRSGPALSTKRASPTSMPMGTPTSCGVTARGSRALDDGWREYCRQSGGRRRQQSVLRPGAARCERRQQDRVLLRHSNGQVVMWETDGATITSNHTVLSGATPRCQRSRQEICDDAGVSDAGGSA